MAYSDFDLEFSTRLQSTFATPGSEMQSPPSGESVQNSSLPNPLTTTGDYCRAIQHNAFNQTEPSVGQVRMMLANTGGVSAQAFYDVADSDLVSLRMRVRMDRVSGDPEGADSADNALTMVGVTAFSAPKRDISGDDIGQKVAYSGGYELVLQAKGSGASRTVEASLRATPALSFGSTSDLTSFGLVQACSGTYDLGLWYHLRLDVVPNSPYQKTLIAYSSSDDGANWTQIGQMVVRDDNTNAWSTISPNRAGIISLRCGDETATELYTHYVDDFDARLTPQTLVNQEPTGTLDISGTPKRGETLTLTNNSVEPDGINEAIDYKWQGYLGSASGYEDFLFSTDETLVIPKIGSLQYKGATKVRAKASYRDALGYSAELFSEEVVIQSSPVTFSGDINGEAAAGTTLTAAVAEYENAFENGAFSYQWTLNDAAISGETGTSLVVPNTGIDGQEIKFEITRTTVEGASTNTVPAATYKDTLATDVLLSETPHNLIGGASAIGKQGDYSEGLYLSVVDTDVNDEYTYTFETGSGDQHNSYFQLSTTSLPAGVAGLSIIWDGSALFPDEWPSEETFYVRIRATNDTTGAIIEKSFVLDNKESNQAPVASEPLVAQTATEGEAFSYTFSAAAFTDADGDALTYSADRLSGDPLPAWLSFDSASRTFSGTPSYADVGGITVRVTASDGQASTTSTFSLTVAAAVSYSLTVAPSAVNEGDAFTTTVSTTAVAENTVLYWSVSGATEADFSSGALTGSGTVDAQGGFSFSHTVAEDATTEGPEVFTIALFTDEARTQQVASDQVAVADTSTEPAQDAPVITGDAAISVAEGTSNSNPLATYTADQSVTWGLSGDDSVFLNISGNGELFFNSTPDFESPQDTDGNNVYSIVVEATPSGGGTAGTLSVSVTVNNIDDTAPTFEIAPTAVSVVENNTFVALYKTNEAATFALQGADSGLFEFTTVSANEANLVFKAAPDFEAPASAASSNVYSVSVVATDGSSNAAAPVAVTITVTDADEIAPVAPTASLSNDTSGGSFITQDATLALADVEAGATVEYSIDSQVSWNAAAPAFLDGQTYNLYVRQTDAAGNVSPASSVLTFTVDQTAPVFSSGTTASVNENSGANQVVYTAVATDANSFSYTLSGPDSGVLSVHPTSGAVTLADDPDYDSGKTSYSFTITATDVAGNATSQTVTLSVNDLDDVNPVITGDAAVNVAEGQTAVATYTADESVTWSHEGADAGLFEISAAGALTFKAAPDFETPASAANSNVYDVVVKATDAAGNTSTLTVAVTVTNVNENPVGTVVISGTGLEGQTLTADVSGISDPDSAGALTFSYLWSTGATTSTYVVQPADVGQDITVQVSYTDDGGTLETLTSEPLNIAAGMAISSATSASANENQTAVYTITVANEPATGTLAYAISGTDAGSFSVDPATGVVTANAALDYESKSSYSIVVEASKDGQSASRTVAISVTDVNEAPTALSFANTTSSLQEDADTTSRIHVADIVVTDDALGTNALSLSDGTYFEIDGQALYLKAAVSLDFESLPANPLAVTVTATDAALGESVSAVFELTVTDVNEAPAISLANQVSALAEAVYATTTKVADIVVTDDALGTNALSLSGDDAASFSIVGTELHLNAVTLDFETKNSYSVTVVVNDGTNAPAQASFTLSVTNANEAPTNLLLSGGLSVSFAEEQAVGSVVGVLSASDQDAGDTPTFSLVAGIGDNDNGSFSIVGNELRAGTQFSFESLADPALSVRVRATDAGGLSVEQAFTVNITDVNEAPAISLANQVNTLSEGSYGASTKVADIVITDDALGTNALSLSGADAASFSIVNDSELHINAGNFDAEGVKTTYSVTVVVDDGANTPAEASFSLTITNVNEAPTAIALSATSFNENIDAGTVVATLSGTDPDLGDSLTFSLEAGTGDTDNGSFTIEGNSLKINASPDFEAQASYSIRVRATDAGGLSVEQAFTLNVNDLDDTAPVITGDAAVSIVENTTAVATYSSEAGVTWSLAGADKDLFSLVDGVLSFQAAPDFETPLDADTNNVYAVVVEATDAAGNKGTLSVDVTVADADEVAPTITSGAVAASIAENSGANQVIYTATADESVTWSLKAVDDHAAFNLSDNEVTLTANPDFETKSSYSFTVIATDAAGNSSEQAVSLSITDADEVAAVLLSAVPVDGATNVEVGTNVVLTFDEAVFAGTGNIHLMTDYSEGHASVEQFAATDPRVSFSADNKTVTINFASDLAYGTAYHLDIGSAGDVFVDAAGNGYLRSHADYNFSTVAAMAFSTSGPVSFAENTSVNTEVYNAQVVNAPATVTFSLSGADAASFSLNTSTGALKFLSSPNYEDQASYSVTISADSGSQSISQNVTVNVTDANEAPTAITLSNASVSEGLAAGTVVGTLAATDPDAGDTITFSVTSDYFQISGNELQTKLELDREAIDSHSVTVTATDASGLSFNETFTITVTNANEDPSVSIDGLLHVGETLSLTIADEDGLTGATFSYEWFRLGNATAIATGSSYTLTGSDEGAVLYAVVSYTDDQGTAESATSAQTAAIDPAMTFTSVASVSVAENSGAGQVVYTASVADAPDAVVYTFSGADIDNGLLTVSGNQVTLVADPDFEVKASYAFSVQAVSSAQDISQAVTVNVTDVDDTPPTFSAKAGYQESAVTQQETSNLLFLFWFRSPYAYNWTLEGADAALFSLLVGQGDKEPIVRRSGGFDYEAPLDANSDNVYEVTIRATSPVSGLTTTRDLTITVTDKVEAASITFANTTTSLSEDTSTASAIKLADIVGGGDASDDTLSVSNTDYFEIVGNNALYLKAGVSLSVGSLQTVVTGTDPASSATLNSDPFSLTITNVNDAPTDISISLNGTNGYINENTAGGSVVGTISGSDPDNDALVFSLVAGTGDTDNAKFTIDGSSLKLAADHSPDIETQSSYAIRVQASDGSLVFEKEFTLGVYNLNDAPTGSVTIDGVLNENEVLTANTSTLNDQDVNPWPPSFSYQWKRGGVNILGATSSTYTLVSDDVAANISVSVTYTNNTLNGAPTTTVTSAEYGPVEAAAAPPIGETWTGTAWSSSYAVYGVTWDSSQAKFIASGYATADSTAKWLSSSDGQTWSEVSYTSSVSLTGRPAMQTAHAVVNGTSHLIAVTRTQVGGSRYILKSTDNGASWDTVAYPLNNMSHVFWTGSVFLACDTSSGTPFLYKMTPPASGEISSLTSMSSAKRFDNNSARFAVGAGKLVLVSKVPSNASGSHVSIQYTTDLTGTTGWTYATGPSSTDAFTDVTYGDGRFVAVGPDGVWQSTDGASWTEVTLSATEAALPWGTVVWGGPAGEERFVAFTEHTSTTYDDTSVVMSSADGLTWAAQTTPAGSANRWRSAVAGGGKVVASAQPWGSVVGNLKFLVSE